MKHKKSKKVNRNKKMSWSEVTLQNANGIPLNAIREAMGCKPIKSK
jgi:hypothetical protein